MALTAPQVVWARSEVVRLYGAAALDVTKADIDGSVAALVTWAENNSASALAAMAGTALASKSTAVKAQVLAIAIMARYGGVA